MYVHPLSRYRVSLRAQNFEDLKYLYFRVLPQVKIRYRRSWRDTYHGFTDRVVSTEQLTPRWYQFSSLNSLRVTAITPEGHHRGISVRIHDTLEYQGSKDWYGVHEWLPTQELYYIGLDTCTLVHGPIREGSLITQGAMHYTLKHTSLAYLAEKVRTLGDQVRREGYEKIYFLRSKLLTGLILDGAQNGVLQGYPEKAWEHLSKVWVERDRLVGALLHSKAKKLLIDGSIQFQEMTQLGNIQSIYVSPDLQGVHLNQFMKLGFIDKVKILPYTSLLPSYPKLKYLATKYF